MQIPIYDSDGLVKRRVYLDEATQRYVVETSQDIGSILEYNKRLYNESTKSGYQTKDKSIQWVGRIPNIVIEQIKKEHGLNIFVKEDVPKIIKLLNDPDYRHLRVSGGIL